MTRAELFRHIIKKQSFLCVGLDTDLQRIPDHLRYKPDPIFAFNKDIIDHTRDLCVAYKPNVAFYEAAGRSGWTALEKTIDYIGHEHLIIADAKRGDIGNTSSLYAKAFFETLGADAITVAPYMGYDSVQPFMDHPGKWVILLALTSNSGSKDFQQKKLEGEKLYKQVLKTSKSWGDPDNVMYVIGATHPEDFVEVRNIVPDHFLLVPGIGAQGGDLKGVCHYGMNDQVGLIVNASRSIIYAGSGMDFAEKARQSARLIQEEMKVILEERGLLNKT